MSVDPTREDIKTLVDIRNMAAGKIAVGYFKPAVYLIGELKKEVVNRDLPMSFFNNMLDELLVIAKESSNDPFILVLFERYMDSLDISFN